MKIHEYQAKQVFAKYGVPIPAGEVATQVDEVVEIAERLGYPVVVKAQVHVGGRGKAGGVKLAKTAAEARAAGEAILGMDIKGLTVEQVLIEQAVDIAEEYYLGITLDRANQRNVLILSAAGGMDIEQVAAETPEKVVRVGIDPAFGLLPHQIVAGLYEAGINPKVIREATKFVLTLDRVYQDIDASLAEINPLAVTGEGQVIAADAKINIDDNALFRQTELAALSESSDEDEIEAEAHRRGIQFVRLQAENIGGAAPAIGVIGNGAGLVMGTLDEVTRVGRGYGVGPANFLDVGGGATKEKVTAAFKIILSDKNVEGILVNIFGGIMRCDIIAEGVVAAAKEVSLKVPLVVRLEGTNVDLGKKIMAESGLPIISADNLADAAEKIVKAVKEAA